MSLEIEFNGESISIPDDSVYAICTAPVNIAVIKYWGKRDESLILPINSSLSATLDQGSMKSNTLIIASRSYRAHTLSLNNREEKLNKRITSVINACQLLAQPFINTKTNATLIDDWSLYHLRIISFNNFPTAAGLASSAAGYACLTACLAAVYQIQEEFEGQLTTLARVGSGSACRSMYGGWVRWRMGELADGTDSTASVVVPSSHWPQMRVLILVANNAQKETSSTDGMQRSVDTSQLLLFRASSIVPQRMSDMETALQQRDFESFAHLTMADSNQFHACCLDTFPPIIYLNFTSQNIINLIHQINIFCRRTIAAYTFDAGPNAVIYCLESDMALLIRLFRYYYNSNNDNNNDNNNIKSFIYDPMDLTSSTPGWNESLDEDIVSACGKIATHVKVHQLIVTKVGEGPIITTKQHTFDSTNTNSK